MVLGEAQRNEQIEQETWKLSSGYRKVPAPDIDLEILKLKREINRLEALKVNPEIDLAKKAKLREDVMKHQLEQARQNVATEMQFEQQDIDHKNILGGV